LRNASSHRPIIEDHRSHLRDELGIIDHRGGASAPAPEPSLSTEVPKTRLRLNVLA
jgi:hypothetical protein